MSRDIRSFVRLVDRAPAPEIWEEIGARSPRAPLPEPGRGRRTAAAVVALVVAMAGFWVVYKAIRDPGTRAGVNNPAQPIGESPAPSLTGEPRITAEIALPDDSFSGGLAVGAGSAWVGILTRQGSESEEQAVARIDLATNQIVAEIPVAQAPSRKRIAATDDAVWVASHGLVERIDPATNTVVSRIPIPGRGISAIAADSTAVWAVTIGEISDDGAVGDGSLVRIDPASNEIVAEIPLGSQLTGYEDEVRLGAGAVWVMGVRWVEPENTEYGSDLIRIDPETNEIVARVPVGGFGMAVGADEVWVSFPADGAFDAGGERWLWARVDARTNEVSEPFALDARGLKAVTSEALWSVDYDEQEHVRVTRFDPVTLEAVATSEAIRSYFHDAVLDPASGTVWISAVENVVRVDIS